MLFGIFHKGSGLGNQLHRYIAIRIKAQELGVDFGMVALDLFKGKSFMDLDMGKNLHVRYKVEEPSGKVVPTQFIVHYNPSFEFPPAPDFDVWEEWDKQVFDPDFDFVEDNTIIDGNFEDPKYFEEHLDDIDRWLTTEYISFPDDVCVIGFRGGEFYTVPELGLPKEYYDRAIQIMKDKGITKFEVHTDDPELAKQFFSDYKIIQDISVNWRSVRYAKHAIIANSSFYILPRLLNGGLTIAPRYWNRYNTKKWDYPQNYYKQFKYI